MSGSGVLRGPASGRGRVGGEGPGRGRPHPGPGVQRPRCGRTVRFGCVVATRGQGPGALRLGGLSLPACPHSPLFPGGPGRSAGGERPIPSGRGVAALVLLGARVPGNGAADRGPREILTVPVYGQRVGNSGSRSQTRPYLVNHPSPPQREGAAPRSRVRWPRVGKSRKLRLPRKSQRPAAVAQCGAPSAQRCVRWRLAAGGRPREGHCPS